MAFDFMGIIPPVVTPFDGNGDIKTAAIRANVRFLLDKGVHGICFGGSTGEGHTLTGDELVTIAEECAAEVNGAVPLIAGIIVNSTRDAVQKARRMEGLVDAFQITPVHYLFKPDDDATYRHFETITAETEKPVLIYNVIPWNYLSPALLVRLMEGLPGILGVKQSAGDLKLFADLMVSAPEGKRIYSAIDALLYPAFAMGSHGTIAANPAAVPGPCVALWNAVQAGDHALGRQIHESLLRFWNTIFADNLPANVKTALSLQGCDAGLPRAPMPATSPERAARIEAALEQLLRFEGAVAHAKAA
ncbi:dihydrodipicolinate synthase family protein [Acuticoccus sp. MNP-M23]|uniref:dihydrodipicolinate synthase family protein n=1 Tax=Acuticoccus sp. MNP-M23 TaxID=3072793 RepID=UPI002815E7FB|nr:dihydrodipicolinate synthase family protein [Acuticoccus sp. MNP-M23]WMS44652.1 dihydrodipicolinate synthase family protein [Acuticoccus sp. MNP-M23]